MKKNHLYEKLRAGHTCIGTRINSADMIELCAHVEFDWFMLDQMFTANDWGRTEDFIRTAEAAEITPVIRVQSSPWIGYDHRVAVEVSRAMGIGAQYVMVSNSGKKEIEESVEVAKGWHRKAMIIHPFGDFSDWEKVREREENYVIPQPESTGALEALDETIKLPGVKMLFFATTDAVMMVTGEKKPDWYHPKFWEYIDRAVALGKKHDCIIGADTSYAYDMDELENRVRHLHEHGVKMIMVQSANFMFQVAANKFLRNLKPVLS